MSYFGYISPVDPARKYLIVQAGPTAIRADSHRNHRFQDLLMDLPFLGIDDAAIHTGYQALIFRRLRPVGRRILQTDLRGIKE